MKKSAGRFIEILIISDFVPLRKLFFCPLYRYYIPVDEVEIDGKMHKYYESIYS